MQSTSYFRLRIVVGLLALAGPFVNRAQSSPILFFTQPFSNQGGSDVMASGNLGPYSFSGEFCLDEACQAGPRGTTLRFTNATLTCQGQLACGAVDVRFEADGFTSFNQLNVALALDGFGNTSGFAGVCLRTETSICPSNLQGTQSTFIAFDGPIAGAATANFDTGGQQFDLLGGFHLDGLNANSLVTLGDSFKITVTPIVGNGAVPEPKTFSLIGLGLLALVILRKTFDKT